jgi:CMP-N,N'-diacetyllegionaminic acid synthase
MKYKLVALIPARSGSERIKNKNISLLNKKPLLAYSIIEAKKSNLFEKIVVSTDSIKYKNIALKYGADVPYLRKKKYSGSASPDFYWVKDLFKYFEKKKIFYSHFFILRPTSPFRTHKTIIRAWKQFCKSKCDSLRAIEKIQQRPEKMWILNKNYLKPYDKKLKKISGQPYYNSQSKSFKDLYIQNASLEISKSFVLRRYKTITGKKIVPFFTKKYEGFDINEKQDLVNARVIIKKNIF